MALSNNPIVLGGGATSVPSGTVPVGGPGTSTDNAIARWQGTAGNEIQNSVIIVADTTGAMSGWTTGNGLTFHGGGTVTGADGALTLTASGTNQNITLTPSGTGDFVVQHPAMKFLVDEDTAAGDHIGVYALATATAPSASNYLLATNGSTAYINGPGGTLNFAAGGSTQAILTSGSFSMTGTITESRAALATTSTDGVIVQNTTAATSGVPVQISPRLRLRTNVWNTNGAGAAHVNDMFIEALGVSGDPTSTLLKFGSIINGAAATYPMTLGSAGALTLLGAITTSAPASGAGAWELGTLITSGTSALSTTSYVEIEIGGALVKLGVVTNS